MVALIATVVSGGLLAGCGTSEPDRVSKAAMVRKADKVCTAGLRDADRLRAQAKPGASGKAAGAEIDASIEVLQRQIDAFADLRGPASTDAAREQAVSQLGLARDGLERLRAAAVDHGLTVDAAIQANPGVVQQVNRASAKASDALGELGFLTCIGVASG